MSSYGVFAQYYDSLTQNAEYKVRSEFISGFFNSENKRDYHILDIACGTGTVAKYLSDMGYSVSGLDISEEMLSVASSKLCAPLYKSDMRDFDFNKSFDACICTLDSLNHLENTEDWQRCFESVYKSLKKDGLFIFDVNTVYKHNEILADNTFVFDTDECFLCWDNELIESGKVRIILDFFIPIDEDRNAYQRFNEDFIEQAFEIEEITAMLENFEILGIYDDMSKNAPHDKSERIYFICKRK